jgi:predicted nucleic acid-binding protein
VALIALDASVLIALLDPDDPHHQAARSALDAHADHDLRIPAHTLAEALVHPVRAGKEREARRLIAALEIGCGRGGEAPCAARECAPDARRAGARLRRRPQGEARADR